MGSTMSGMSQGRPAVSEGLAAPIEPRLRVTAQEVYGRWTDCIAAHAARLGAGKPREDAFLLHIKLQGPGYGFCPAVKCALRPACDRISAGLPPGADTSRRRARGRGSAGAMATSRRGGGSLLMGVGGQWLVRGGAGPSPVPARCHFAQWCRMDGETIQDR